jgi:hypothetical protein
MMRLLEEAQAKGIPISHATPIFRCTIFEDKSGCVELANIPKLRTRTRQMNLKYHHFREHVANKSIHTCCRQVPILSKGTLRLVVLPLADEGVSWYTDASWAYTTAFLHKSTYYTSADPTS